MTEPALFAVDAGGSRTRVLVRCPAGRTRTFELGSVNPDAVGPAADRVLREVFAGVRNLVDGRPSVGWLASAAVHSELPAREVDRATAAAADAGLAATLVISNDVVPLLWGVPSLNGEGVVAVCGTGSGFLGADRSGRVVRAGGCEYLGSDEGGAVDLGLRGLRAAVRAADGRGAATGLVEAFGRDRGAEPDRLARQLAAEPFPKQPLAGLAPTVTATWLAGDTVAADVVGQIVTELVVGIRAVRDRLGLAAGFAVATAGGVLAGCRPLYAQLADRLRTELGAGRIELVTDTASSVLAALTTVLGADHRPALPRGVAGRHAWVLAGAKEEQCS